VTKSTQHVRGDAGIMLCFAFDALGPARLSKGVAYENSPTRPGEASAGNRPIGNNH